MSSPIEYPDLLAGADAADQQEGGGGGRGRKSTANRFMSTLRSRSRSRRSAYDDQRRSASAQPTERKSSTKEKSKRRRSLSRHAGRSSDKNKDTDVLDLRENDVKKRSKSKDKKKKKSKSSSPSKRRTSSAEDYPADIINLVDNDEHDYLLDELLTEDINPIKLEKKKTSSILKKTKSSSALDSPRKKSSFSSKQNYSPRGVDRFGKNQRGEDTTTDESDADSITATDLLEKVNARMEQQKLMEELKELRSTLERKDHEIEQLTGQLRMAISTKCDLVIAHTELERIHEMDMQEKDAFANQLKRNTLLNLEIRAEMEIEFMNEIDTLSKQVEESERQRTHENMEKDLEIAQLQEKIRRLEQNAAGFGVATRPEDDKVRFYKKRLGMYDQ